MKNIIATNNLSRLFKTSKNEVLALDNVNIEIQRGKITILRGKSGSGKTTLINLLGGLDKPTSGKIEFIGKINKDSVDANKQEDPIITPIDFNTLSERKKDCLRRTNIGFVFQSVALMSFMTAYENIEIILRMNKVPYNEREEAIMNIATLLNIDKRLHHYPPQMSGGEQQRIAICRAVAHNPQLLLADEPTSQLDIATTVDIMKVFYELSRTRNLSFVITTHDPRLFSMADRIYTLSDGKIVDIEDKD